MKLDRRTQLSRRVSLTSRRSTVLDTLFSHNVGHVFSSISVQMIALLFVSKGVQPPGRTDQGLQLHCWVVCGITMVILTMPNISQMYNVFESDFSNYKEFQS